MAGAQSRQQQLGLRCVAGLARGQSHAQQPPGGIDQNMQLGAVTAPNVALGLDLREAWSPDRPTALTWQRTREESRCTRLRLARLSATAVSMRAQPQFGTSGERRCSRGRTGAVSL